MTTKHLGPYEIIGVLGRGGMGTVFKGRHDTTGEIVAIKALSHANSDETHFRTRFESEIQALLKLNHPNIVRILSFGQEKGTLFFAMELVEGKSLFHIQREIKKFDWRDVLKIARDVALALRHAHDRGIIHRDLKPGNLMKSDEDGIIKVADFGIAKSFGSNNDTRDNVIGTLDFMSPEQASGKPVSVRTDLYSLGAVLFTLLAGQPPFAANSIEESLRNLTRVPAPPVRDRVSNVPEEMEMLIAELLEKKPENRTATAYALLKKLDYVEQVLRENSKALTAHGIQPEVTSANPSTKPKSKPDVAKPPVGSLPHHEQFLLGEPENMLDKTNAEATKRPASPSPPKSARNPMADATRLSVETEEKPLHDEEIEIEIKLPEPVVRHDYFNTVTETHRKAYFDEPEATTARKGMGWFPIFLAFAAVLGAASYGTYKALQPPTAQSLYEVIEANASSPERIRSEISQFLEIYPEEKRAPAVRRLLSLAEAQSLYKLLAVRQNLPGENKLSDIEQKFVTAIADVNQDPAAGIVKLKAFLTLYGTGSSIRTVSPSDQEAINAAQIFSDNMGSKVEQRERDVRQEIMQAFQRAELNPDEATEIYESIVSLYSEADYVRDLVEKARAALDRNR